MLALVPVALALHNLEEALTIAAALPAMEARWAAFMGRPVDLPSPSQYYVGLPLLAAFAFALWLAARRWSGAATALLALQAVMAVNVLMHVGAAALLGGYAPGLFTALLVEAPVSVTLFRRLRRERGGDPAAATTR